MGDASPPATVTGSPRRVQVRGDLFHGEVPAGAVYVSRPAPGLRGSRFANPHRVGACRVCGREHDRAAALRAYAQDVAADQDLIASARLQLAGRDLACWCRPELACHADVLLLVAAGHDPVVACQEVLRAAR
jgi:hypothetical protein